MGLYSTLRIAGIHDRQTRLSKRRNTKKKASSDRRRRRHRPPPPPPPGTTYTKCKLSALGDWLID